MTQLFAIRKHNTFGETFCAFKPLEEKKHDAETLEISRRMEEGKAEKKKRMKEKIKFYCPYTCSFTGKKCGVHFHAFKYAGALVHLKTCEHKDVAVMKVYMLEKGLLN